jgi:hypothetical protein
MTEERRVTWMHAGDRYPDLAGDRDHFIAMDGEIEVGVVKRIESGAETGSWLWSMTRMHPGPPLNVPRSGTCETRGEAARELVQCWQAFRQYYGFRD